MIVHAKDSWDRPSGVCESILVLGFGIPVGVFNFAAGGLFPYVV